MLLALTVSIPVALRLLGVEDWRCYGLAILTAPFVDALSIGALTPFLLVGAALTWRFRARPLIVALAAAVTGVAKVFLWPIGVWLIATRRFRAAAVCLGAAVGLLLVGWGAIAFAGLGSYPHLLRVLSDVEASESYSVVGLLGLTGSAAAVVSLSLSAAVVGSYGCCRTGHRRGPPRVCCCDCRLGPRSSGPSGSTISCCFSFRWRCFVRDSLPSGFSHLSSGRRLSPTPTGSPGESWLLCWQALRSLLGTLWRPGRSARPAAVYAPGAASIPLRP